MLESNLLLLEVTFLLLATLYSVTGHGGASGYIAIMALLGMAPQEMKPIALSLNIIVSLIATIQFYGAGHFRRALFLPFAMGSVPLAMVGGYVQLPTHWFNALMGMALIFAALRIGIKPLRTITQNSPPLLPALAAGSAIGLLSGLIGVGGGIFLTPLLLLMGWANSRQAAAVSAPFILLNSISGLAGFNTQVSYSLPASMACLVMAVLIGGLLGSFMGSRYLPMQVVSRFLSLVLLLAGFKLFYV